VQAPPSTAGVGWAGVAALLKAYRGVSEVISTIMLNAISTGVIAYLIRPDTFGVLEGNNISTKPIEPSGQFPGISLGDKGTVFGMVFVAAALGVGYWFMLGRTRFGFELKASGESPTAAAAGGVNARRMTVLALLEGYATALAAPHLGKAELQELRDINDRMVAAIDGLDSLTFGRLNQEFHSRIYDECPNAALVDMLRDVARRLDAIRRTVFVQIPYRGTTSVAEHKELIRLIETNAPAAEIEAVARAHKLATVDSFRAWRDEHQS